MTPQLGYCCINLSLKDSGISTNRGIKKATWLSQGLPLVSQIAVQNLTDLLAILKWNVSNDIKVYRMPSDIFPWMSEYNLSDLPNFESQVLPLLKEIGSFAMANGIRLSFHPGQYTVLASPTEKTVIASINDLEKHTSVMNLMGLPHTHEFPINIHIGGTYGDMDSAASRFCSNFDKLSDSAKSSLVIENDDKESQYSVSDLYTKIYKNIGTPITFDHFHHFLHSRGQLSYDAAHLAAETWKSVRPLQHYSSSKQINESSLAIKRAHADFIYEVIPHFGLSCDIEIEAKAKDLALLKYRNQFLNYAT